MLKYHTTSKTLWSLDQKQIKVFEKDSGKHFSSIQSRFQINDFHVVEWSGLVLAAQDDPLMGAFFLTQIGPAPHWIAHLDGITEEMEET